MSILKYAGIAATAGLLAKINKKAANNYLASTLGSTPGVPAKFAQFIQMLDDSALNINKSHPEPLPLDFINDYLQQESPELFRQVVEIDKEPLVASLSQVHKVKLKDQSELAVKFQFPDIAPEIETQFQVIEKALKLSPAAKFGLNTEEWISYFKSSLRLELDYKAELNNQKECFRYFSMFEHIQIPNVYPEYSSNKILVQEFCQGLSLDQIVQLDTDKKQLIANKLTEFIFHSLFNLNLVHGDLQPQNWSYNLEDNKIIVYDFGSMIQISDKWKNAFLKLVKSAIENNQDLATEALLDLEFDSEKLKLYKDSALPLVQALIHPLVSSDFWNPKDWNLAVQIDKILDDKKWWFRTSGSPWFLHFMRTIGYWAISIEKLQVSVPVRFIFNRITHQQTPISDLSGFINTSINVSNKTSTKAKNLFVRVSEKGNDLVSIEMPVVAVDDLENLVSDDTKRKIEESGYNLLDIKNKIQKSGYSAQEVLNINLNEKNYLIWIK